MALPVSAVKLSFCASQITTQGWFQRSRIHSMYSGMIFSASGNSVGSILAGLRVQDPDRKLVLDQEAFLVGDVVPELRREADAVADGVPVHLLNCWCSRRTQSARQGRSPRCASSKKR